MVMGEILKGCAGCEMFENIAGVGYDNLSIKYSLISNYPLKPNDGIDICYPPSYIVTHCLDLNFFFASFVIIKGYNCVFFLPSFLLVLQS